MTRRRHVKSWTTLTGILLWGKGGRKWPVKVNSVDVSRSIEEVVYEDGQVDTILVCVNAPMMYDPTMVGHMRGCLF